jgi:hypothetical protein
MATISTALTTPTKYMVEQATAVYEAAAVPQNDVIQMVSIPQNAVILDVILDYDALGASSALTVGDGGSSARFITSTATTSAGVARLNSAADVGRGYKYTADDTVDITVSGTGAITGTVRLTVTFYRDFT